MHILAIGDDTGGYDLLMARCQAARSSGDHPGSGASRKVGKWGTAGDWNEVPKCLV